MDEHITTTKRKEDHAVDMEQQFILRLPACPAFALKNDLEHGSQTLKDKFSIELQPDMRHSLIRYGNEVFKAKLKDMPCVIESFKTIDRKTFYKTADVYQILLCKETFSSSDEETDVAKKRDPDKRHKYLHGVTPPLKNVRRRRFRKTLRKKYPDQPEIEKEVKRLFDTDAASIDVKWEVVVEEADNKHTDKIKVVLRGETNIEEEFKDEENQNILGIAARDLFGDDLSSSDEEASNLKITSLLLGEDYQQTEAGAASHDLELPKAGGTISYTTQSYFKGF